MTSDQIPWVTSCVPNQKECVRVTPTAASSSLRPASLSGEPMVKLPAGIRRPSGFTGAGRFCDASPLGSTTLPGVGASPPRLRTSAAPAAEVAIAPMTTPFRNLRCVTARGWGVTASCGAESVALRGEEETWWGTAAVGGAGVAVGGGEDAEGVAMEIGAGAGVAAGAAGAAGGFGDLGG